jgi:ribokinase
MDERKKAGRLTIIGDVGVDLVMGPVEGWPAIGTETIVPRSETRLGGSAGNTLLAMRCLGAECRLLSHTGNDMFGAWLAGQVERLGGTLGSVDAPTSITTAIIHECGERSFFTTRGHFEHVSWESQRADLDDAGDGDIALLTGVFLLPKLRAAYPSLLLELRRRGYGIALDTGWPSEGWTAAVRREVADWIPHCDHLLVNEVELTDLTGESDIDRATAAVSALLPADATLVVKLGAKGAIGRQGGSTCSARAPEVIPFDTIGAGDSFNAGYLHARLGGRDLTRSLNAGCTLASRIISRFPRHAIAPGELASAVA